MARALLFSVALALHANAAPLPALNATAYAALREAVRTAFSPPLAPSYGTVCLACDLGHSVGGVVRLAFHDATGAAGANGRVGPNGCLDLTTADNANLDDIIDVLDAAQARSPYGQLLSRADFWVLAATYVIELTSKLAVGYEPGLFSADAANPMDLRAAPLLLPFYTGRIDQPVCPGDHDFLPAPSYNWTQILGVFQARMGMSADEVVAIMGAHSLGGIKSAVNGNITGSWVQSSTSFSNSYYSVLLNGRLGWFGARDVAGALTPASVANSSETDAYAMSVRVAGTARNASIVMLRSDVELGVNTTSEWAPAGGPAQANGCSVFGLGMAPVGLAPGAGAGGLSLKQNASCPRRERNLATIGGFARDTGAWHGNFSRAWAKMVTLGYGAGELCAVGDVSAACGGPAAPTPSAAPASAGAAGSGRTVGVAVGASLGGAAVVAAVGAFYAWRVRGRGGVLLKEDSPLLGPGV